MDFSVTKESRPIYLLGSLGMGLFWTWTLLTGYSLLLFSGTAGSTALADNVWTWNSWAQAITFIFIALFASVFQRLFSHKALLPLFAGLATLSTVLLPTCVTFFQLDSTPATVLGYVSSALTGVTGAFLVLMWVELLSACGSKRSTFIMNAGLVLSALFYIIIAQLPSIVAVALVSLLPCISGWLLYRCKKWASTNPAIARKHAPETPACPASTSLRILIPLCTLFFCALCGEIFRNLIVITQAEVGFVMMGSVYAIGGGIGVLLLSIVLLVKQSRKTMQNETLVLRLTLSVLVVGYLVTVVFDVHLIVGYIFFSAVYGSLRALAWMFTARAVEQTQISPLRAFGISLSAFSIPVAIGGSFINSLATEIAGGAIPWTTVATTIIGVLFAIAIVILDPHDLRTCWGLITRNVSEEDAFTEINEEGNAISPTSVNCLKAQYKLTDRELEIAKLLYQGRSIPYICQNLYIAEGTATTHLRHIYNKMNVHNRQEFITVVKQTISAGPDL